jgi:altronate dehydratase
MEQTAFRIHLEDNVATALTPLAPGEVSILGDGAPERIACVEAVPNSHKIALRDIAEGEKIIKYGVPIGCATRAIPRGSWVHLHVMRSLYDERSSHLDINTGAPKDTKYE